VVDDDPDFVEITRTILEANGYEIASASNGDEALQTMRQDPPDLVLLDIMMSTVLDGVRVSYEMQRDPALKEIPVIGVSSIAGSPHVGMFPTDERIPPMQAWISKPVQPDELLSKVRRFIKS